MSDVNPTSLKQDAVEKCAREVNDFLVPHAVHGTWYGLKPTEKDITDQAEIIETKLIKGVEE